MPVEATLAATFFMSQGARNWPFLMLTGLPVAPAASSRSVWRHRKAGICSTSTTSATGAHCSVSCTSVSTGRPVRLAHFGEDRQPGLEPDAARAADRGAVRLVERGLVDQRRCRAWRRSRPARALISSACARDFERVGPAMSTSGRSLPIVMSPIATWRGVMAPDSVRRAVAPSSLRGAQATKQSRRCAVAGGARLPRCARDDMDRLHARPLLTPAATGRARRWMNEVNSGCGSNGRRFQLGMELHADEPGMVGNLDDLGQRCRRATCRKSAGPPPPAGPCSRC